MKVLYRDFTLKEKIITVILSILLFAVFYFYVIKIPLDNAILDANMQRDNLSNEINIVQIKVDRYERMKSELDNLEEVSSMPSYNASKDEIAFLDSILLNTEEYGIKFTGCTREGDLIRRQFYFNFRVMDQNQVQTILKKLIHCPYRCFVQDISCNSTKEGYTVTGNATFYETLNGGKVDAALPEDSLSQESHPTLEELEEPYY